MTTYAKCRHDVRVRPARPACALALLAAMTTALPARAQPAATPGATNPPRTVTWYADNPRERARVQLACLDDPGRLSSNRDCVNAQKASVEVALRSARSRTGTTDPRNPQFWSDDPEARAGQLILCRRDPALQHCDAAKKSLLIEAGLRAK